MQSLSAKQCLTLDRQPALLSRIGEGLVNSQKVFILLQGCIDIDKDGQISLLYVSTSMISIKSACWLIGFKKKMTLYVSAMFCFPWVYKWNL